MSVKTPTERLRSAPGADRPSQAPVSSSPRSLDVRGHSMRAVAFFIGFLAAVGCNGSVAADCADGTSRCGNRCTTTDLDPNNCGGCGKKCAAGEVCSDGACGVACPPGYAMCTNGGPHCAKLESDPNDCGACGNTCNGEHAVPTCRSGACAPICLAAFADCDMNPATGCEVDLATTSSSCGKCGHDCLGGDCTRGVCQPVALALEEGYPSALAIDASNVYWANWGYAQIRVCAKAGCGGKPTTLATNQGYPISIAVDGTNVYWTSGGNILKCAIGGCNATPTTFASGPSNPGPFGIAADGVNVYWTNFAQFSKVQKCAVGGCGGVPTELATAIYPEAIATDGKNVFYTQYTSVRYCAVSGCAMNPTSLSGQGGNAIAVDAANVYVASAGVTKCAISGCNLTPTVLAPDTASGIAVDATDVYWTSAEKGTVSRCAIAGCNNTPTVLAVGQPRPTAIAVDATAIYFADYAYRSPVMRLAK